jgi:PPOX class probable F420-dependent enzyme
MPSLTPAESRRRFTTANVARLATASAAAVPHIVPIVFAVHADTVYYGVDAKPKATTALRRLANLAENPVAALLADHYSDDWTTLWWTRADGRSRELAADSRELRHALTLLEARYPQFVLRGTMLAVDVTRWSGWTAT